MADGVPMPITYEGPESLKGLYGSINRAIGVNPELKDWQTRTGTKEGHRKVSVLLNFNGSQSSGEGEATSDVEAGVLAYLDALNQLPYQQPSLF